VRREWPRGGHRSEHNVDSLIAGHLESVAFDHVDQCGFRHIELYRPIAIGQPPANLPRALVPDSAPRASSRTPSKDSAPAV
jgi:hypothetical protein